MSGHKVLETKEERWARPDINTKMIEEHRKKHVSDEMNKRARFDKSSKSKDVIIETKDKRIAVLEAENKRLKAEIAILRGLVYADKKSYHVEDM